MSLNNKFQYVCTECASKDDIVILQREVYRCLHHLTVDQYSRLREIVKEVKVNYKNKDLILAGEQIEYSVYDIHMCISCAIKLAGEPVILNEEYDGW